MKKLLIITVMLLSAATIFGQKQKTGYVDSQVILAQYPEAIKAQGDLDALIKQWQATLQTMRGEYQQLITDYQKQEKTMQQKAKEKAQKNIVTKEQEIQAFYQQKFGQQNGEVVTKQEELLAPVKKKIMEAIQQVAKEEKMTFIFDKSGDIILLYADSEYDMTFKVLDKLKRGK